MKRDILGYKCKKCGQLHYPYRMRCKACGHTEFKGADVVWDVEPLPKTGKLLTYTDLYALPADFEMVKLTLGIIELEGGQRMTAQLKCDSPKIGMKVRGEVEVVRKDDYKKYYGMVFYPAE